MIEVDCPYVCIVEVLSHPIFSNYSLRGVSILVLIINFTNLRKIGFPCSMYVWKWDSKKVFGR